jgi:inorganic phosphate transporter, PiT family
MSDVSLSSRHAGPQGGSRAGRPNLDGGKHWSTIPVFTLLMVCGIGYAVYGLLSDMNEAGQTPLAIGAFLLLGIALLIALGFEFVNGFHDTANAVATVIYTHSLPPVAAVVWSGVWNFLGVLTSSGAVAYTIIALLPSDLVMNVGSGAGFAMIFALLIAAIIWNLGTWWLGIPNSSSHALIGSVIGVGLANQLMAPAGVATAGVQWGAAVGVLKGLLFSPVAGFILAALLLLVLKVVIRNKKLYEAPEGNKPPPLWIRSILVLTCTSVSFAHGGNDGQKGMGLIMLILIGVAPTAFALNRSVPESSTPSFIAASQHAAAVFDAHAAKDAQKLEASEARKRVDDAMNRKDVVNPDVFSALSVLSKDIASQVQSFGAIKKVPAAETTNIRNEMYLTDSAITEIGKQKGAVSDDETKTLKSYKTALEQGTRYIPTWVKVSVAIALGLGTMVGWKRIVTTVGERIGKTHLSYAQGAASEIVAAGTIGLAEMYGLPVSTTHILSSGVAGTMVANGSGLQGSTVRSLIMAWVLTLPVAIVLSGALFFIFRHLF